MTMKQLQHVLLIALLTGSGYNALAQTDKGTFILGVNASRGLWRPESANTANTRLLPAVSYFVRKNTLIGLALPLEYTETTFTEPRNQLRRLAGRSTGLSLVTRRYFLDGRFKPFIHLDGGYTWGDFVLYRSIQGLPVSDIVTGNTVKLNAGLGISYFLSNHFSVEATATLGISNAESVINTKMLSPDNRYLLLGVGLNWHLPTRTNR